MKDLVVLVADKNYAIKGILSRPQALSIRQINFDIFVHPQHDPGCLNDAAYFLRTFLTQYHHALILFDREGCGRENLTREELEAQVEKALYHTGWQQAAVVVLDPELEIWVWSDSPQVIEILGWKNKQPDLISWLRSKGFWRHNEPKPTHAKESLEAALKQVRKPHSSILYQQLAEKVSFERCTDKAFQKLKTTLQNWFSSINWN